MKEGRPMPRHHNDYKFQSLDYEMRNDLMDRSMRAEDIAKLDGFERRQMDFYV
jgi:hypothetical protein